MAFSCNYRDVALIVSFSQRCQEKTSDETIFYSGFGSDFVAEVVDVGENVTSFTINDHVIPDGTYPFKDNGNFPGGVITNCASQRYEIFHEQQLRRIPIRTDKVVASALSISGQTAYSMVRKLRTWDNQKVFVTAATSNTALTLIKILRRMNPTMQIFASTTNLFHKASLENLGVNKVLISPLSDLKPLAALAVEVNGFDIVVDCFSDLYLSKLIEYMTFDGQYITCGVYHQSHAVHKPIGKDSTDFYKIMLLAIQRNITIVGNCLGQHSDLTSAINDLEEGHELITIDSVYSGDQIGQFFNRTFNDRERFGKVVYQY